MKKMTMVSFVFALVLACSSWVQAASITYSFDGSMSLSQENEIVSMNVPSAGFTTESVDWNLSTDETYDYSLSFSLEFSLLVFSKTFAQENVALCTYQGITDLNDLPDINLSLSESGLSFEFDATTSALLSGIMNQIGSSSIGLEGYITLVAEPYQSPAPLPVPGTALLLGSGCCALIGLRRRTV